MGARKKWKCGQPCMTRSPSSPARASSSSWSAIPHVKHKSHWSKHIIIISENCGAGLGAMPTWLGAFLLTLLPVSVVPLHGLGFLCTWPQGHVWRGPAQHVGSSCMSVPKVGSPPAGAVQAPGAYVEVLDMLRGLDTGGSWPSTSRRRRELIRPREEDTSGALPPGDSFTIGLFPPPLRLPHANSALPHLLDALRRFVSHTRTGAHGNPG